MDNDFRQKIHEDRIRLGNPYAHVAGDGTFHALPASTARDSRDAEGPSRPQPRIDLDSIRRTVKHGGRLSTKAIEARARALLAQLWGIRGELFPDERTADPFAILDPLLALRCIGFRPEEVESLGQHLWEGEYVEVAGIFDGVAQTVQISLRFEPPVRKFTAAHELGHAILHGGQGLHRDRALDGTELRSPRDRTEWQADVFATYFLMPEKLVREAFEHAFKAREFVLNEDTAFALNAGSVETLRSTCGDVRGLSRLLARATQFDGVQFYPLAEQFGVSVEAMAIRLEELNLIDW